MSFLYCSFVFLPLATLCYLGPFCISGSVFLLHQHEITAALILALQGVEDTDMAACVPLRYSAVLISKGFLCRTQEVGMIIELHLRVVSLFIYYCFSCFC